ncbi:unnamed protein product [Camellia sinensis]
MASSSTRIVMVSLMIIFAMVSSPLMLESEAARIPHRVINLKGQYAQHVYVVNLHRQTHVVLAVLLLFRLLETKPHRIQEEETR